MSPSSLLLLLGLSLAMSVLPATTLALALPRAVPGFPNPLVDPFYSQPGDIASYSLGHILATRQTVSTFAGNPNLQRSYQIKFRSQNAQLQPIAAVTTVLVPKTKTLTTSGQASILTFQNFQDAVSGSCAPSWAYVKNSGSQAAFAANLEAPIVNGWALDNGYYVVIPDHQGPSSSFIAGTNAGYIILDSIRAALASEKLSTNTQIGSYGYSGGANAGAFGSSLAPSYAPELNIVGVSLGGTPVSPEDTFYFLNGGPFAGFAAAGAQGLASAYPDVQAYLDSVFNAKGRETFARLTADGTCIASVVGQFAFTNVFDLVSPPQDPLLAPAVQNALSKETLLQAKASYTVPVPKHPVFIYHAIFDEVVPFNSSQLYIQEQCAKGADIRSLIYPIGGHITTEILGIPSALEFLGSAFKGTLGKVKCGTLIPEVTLGSSASARLLGSGRVAALQQAKVDGTWGGATGGLP